MKKRTSDNILYLAIALGVVGIGIFSEWYDFSRGLPIRPISTKYATFFFNTIAVFGYGMREWQRAWRNARFWVLLSLLFAAYIPLQWLLMQYIPVNIITFVTVGCLELYALLYILERFLAHEYRRVK